MIKEDRVQSEHGQQTRLDQERRGEMGRESKRGAADQERQPRPRDQEPGIAKMTESYRDQAGGRGVEASPLEGRYLE